MKSRKPASKNITLDSLAGMVQRGFEETAKDITTLRTEMNTRFDHIEKVLLSLQEKRIEKLEKWVGEIRQALAMK